MKTKITEIKEALTCDGCAHSRRDFLAHVAKGLGAVALAGFIEPSSILAAGRAAGVVEDDHTSSAAENRAINGKMNVRLVFVTPGITTEEPCWPNIAYNFSPVIEKMSNTLTNECPEINFTQSIVGSAKQAENILLGDKARGDIDGYLVIHLVSKVHNVIDPFVGSGKPVLYADYIYGGTGGFLGSNSAMLRKQAENYSFMSSGNFAHLVAAANCLPLAMGPGGYKMFVDSVTKVRENIVANVNADMTCVDDKLDLLSIDELRKELKTKRILEYEKGWDDVRKETKEELGIEIIRRPFSELNDMWEKADKEQAMEVVNRWKKESEAVVGVRDLTLEKSARFYLAMKEALKKYDACAITVACLDGFYSGQINAYPCLGFHELLNEGLVGACECDTLSTVTMVVMSTLAKGRPGYISDPVMDLANKQIIYSHCVATNKPFGPGGAVNPFTIMTHSEDRQGASVRSTLPTGYMVTTLKMHPGRKEILLHQAKAVDNSTEDKACRTKLVAVPIGDFEKLFTQWDKWAWHRVTYYGDLKQPVFELADALGWKVVEEA